MLEDGFPVARVPRLSLASRLPSLAWKMRKNNTNLKQGAHIHQPTVTIIINNNNACSASLSKVCEVFSAIACDCYQNFWPSCARAKRGRISKIPYKEEIVGSFFKLAVTRASIPIHYRVTSSNDSPESNDAVVWRFLHPYGLMLDILSRFEWFVPF